MFEPHGLILKLWERIHEAARFHYSFCGRGRDAGNLECHKEDGLPGQAWSSPAMTNKEVNANGKCSQAAGRGCHPSGAISKAANSKPGATVQPTSVHSPRLCADCQACAGTMLAAVRPAARSGAKRHPSDGLGRTGDAFRAPSARRHKSARSRRHRPDASASARRARAGNRSPSTPRGRRRPRPHREKFRENVRLPDAA